MCVCVDQDVCISVNNVVSMIMVYVLWCMAGINDQGSKTLQFIIIISK